MTLNIKLVDVTKCDGCRACMVACKNWNDLPAELDKEFTGYASHTKTSGDTWNNVTYTEVENKDRNEGLNWYFAHTACMHCTSAACQKVCPQNAISHNEFGYVVIDHEKCIGCGYCVGNCPFGVPGVSKREINGKTKKVASKCTMCTDRVSNGLKPACATACHTGSIQFGPKDELLAAAETRLAEVKERYPNANIYNPAGLDGTQMVFILADKPEVYGLPNNPEISQAAIAWKDYVQPGMKLVMGATAMAVVAGVVSNKLFNPRSKGESHDVHEHE